MITYSKQDVIDTLIELKQDVLSRRFSNSGESEKQIALADSDFIDKVLYEFRNLPTRNLSPVIHANWIKEPTYIQDMELFEGRMRCSNCSTLIAPMTGGDNKDKQFHFCPFCGASMTGTVVEETIPTFKNNSDIDTDILPFGE